MILPDIFHIPLFPCQLQRFGYLEMLEMFCTQGPEKEKEIQTLYDAENWKDYAIKVHALKSTSLTIGAERLSEYLIDACLIQPGKSPGSFF